MNAIKVLQVSTERSWRGGEQQIAYLIESAVMLGVEIIVTARKESAFHHWCVEKSIKYYSLGMANGLDVQSALAIKNICRRENIELLHVHSGKGLSIVYISILLGLKIPIIVHRRVDFELKSKGIALAKYNHKLVKRIICVSEAVRQIVRKSVQRPERVMMVYDGIDFGRFTDALPTGYLHREFNIDPSYQLVANVAAYAPHKDYFTFLDTAAIVLKSYPNVHFLAVGDGNLEKELRSYAGKLNITHSVTFTGFRNDVPLLLREIDIFLITSSTEGLGTSIIDAMYNSLPIVATRAGGIPELIENNRNGFVEDPGNSMALAEKVIKLLQGKELAAAMGRKAHDVSLNFSKEVMAKQNVALYQEVIQQENQG